MRARDDASRIMRGLGRNMGHLAKQQKMLTDQSTYEQQKYTNAIRGSEQAQKAATRTVQQQSKETVRAHQQQSRAAITGVRDQSKQTIAAYNEQHRVVTDKIRQTSAENIKNQKLQRDNAIRNINDQKTAEVRRLSDMQRLHREQSGRLATENNLMNESIKRNRAIVNERINGNKRLAEGDKARMERSIATNRTLQSQHAGQIKMYQREAETVKRNADDAVEKEKRSQARRQTQSENYARNRIANETGLHTQRVRAETDAANRLVRVQQQRLEATTVAEKAAVDRRIAQVERTVQAEQRVATRRNQIAQQQIAHQQALYTRVQNVQMGLMGAGQAGIIAGGLIAAGGGMGVRAFNNMTNAAAEFSNQNRIAASVAKEFENSVADIGDAVHAVAREVPVPIEDLQKTFYYTFSALDASLENTTKLVRGFANEAVVGNADITDAARSSIAMINAYDMDVDTAAGTTETLTRIQNMQFNTVKWGALTYQDLSTNIGKVIPAAIRAGQEIEQIGGALAFLTRQGLSAEMASTSTARAMELIAEPRVISRLEGLGVQIRDLTTKEMLPLDQIVKNIGEHMKGMDTSKIDDIANLLAPLDPDEYSKYNALLQETDRVTKALSGPERSQALQGIFQGAGNRIQARRFWDLAIVNYKEFGRLTNEIINDTKAFQDATTLAFNEPLVAMDIYKNRVEVIKNTIGLQLLPYKLQLLEVITRLIDKYEGLDESTKRIISNFAAFGSVAALVGGALVFIVSIFAIATSGLMGISTAILGVNAGIFKITALAAGMSIGVPLAIGAIIAAVVMLIIHWDSVVESFKNAVEWFNNLDGFSQALISTIAALGVTAVIASGALHAAAVGAKAFAAGLAGIALANPILAAITITIGILTKLYRDHTAITRRTAEATKDYTNNLRDQTGAIATVIRENGDLVESVKNLNREYLKQRLEQQGLTDSAFELGINSEDLVDAMMGNEAALARVNIQLRAAAESSGFLDRQLGLITAGVFTTDADRAARAARELAQAIEVEGTAIDASVDAYIRRAEAGTEVEQAIAGILKYQQKDGPLWVSERLHLANLIEIVKSTEDQGAALEGLDPAIQEYISGITGADESTFDLEQQMAETVGIIDSLESSVRAAADAFGEGFDPMDQYTQNLSDINEAARKAAEAASESTRSSIDDQIEAIKEKTSAEISALDNSRTNHKDAIRALEARRDSSIGILEDERDAVEASNVEKAASWEAYIEALRTTVADQQEWHRVIQIIREASGDDYADYLVTQGPRFFELHKKIADQEPAAIREAAELTKQIQNDAQLAQIKRILDAKPEFVAAWGKMSQEAQVLFAANIGVFPDIIDAAIDTSETIMETRLDELASVAGDGAAGVVRSMVAEYGLGAEAIAKVTSDWSSVVASGLSPIIESVGGKPIVIAKGGMDSAMMNMLRRVRRNKGGPIPFTPGAQVGRDSVPAVLTPGEHIWTDKEVAAAGGHDAMKEMRQSVLNRREIGGGYSGARGRGPGTHRWMMNRMVESGIPHRVTSTVRTNRAASYHSPPGHAIDIGAAVRYPGTGSVQGMGQINNWIASKHGSNAAELIWTGPGARNLYHGRPHTYNAKTQAQHKDHVHWATTKLGGEGISGGGMTMLPDMPEVPSQLAEMGLLGDVASEAIESVRSKASAFVGAAASGVGTTGDVSSWIAQAVALTGVPASWIPGLITIAMRESGGNPRAQNNWDINARRGIPSKGLMQTIGPTFESHKIAGHDDIFNPVHNAAAAIMYIRARYGDISNVQQANPNLPPRGYKSGGPVELASGGVVLSPTNAIIAESGPEAVIPLSRLRGLIQDAVSTVRPIDGENRASISDQFSNMMSVLDALAAKTAAAKELIEAKNNVAALREELGSLGNEYRLTLMSLSKIRNEGREIARSQGSMAAALGISSVKWLEAVQSGKVITLETEQSILRQQFSVEKLRQEFVQMKAGPTASDQLSALRAEQQVLDAEKALAELRERGEGEIDPDLVQAAREAQAAVTEAEFEMARVARITPHMEDDVQRLLVKFQAEKQLADAHSQLADATEKLRSEEGERATDLEIRMSELELVIARENAKIATDALSVSSDNLRIHEIELTLAEQELHNQRNDAFQFLPEYIERQERLQEITEAMTTTEQELESAVEAVTTAERNNISAIIGLADATNGLFGLQPEALRYFRSISQEAGITTEAINEQLRVIRQLNKITTRISRARSLGEDAVNRGLPGAGRDLSIIQSGNLEEIGSRILEIFRNRNVPIGLRLDGTYESEGGRLNRLANDIRNGDITFERIRKLVDATKEAHNLALGGIAKRTRGGTLVRVGEGRTDEAIIPLPTGWRTSSVSTPNTIEVHEGAVKVIFEGTVGEGASEDIKEAVSDALDEFIKGLQDDWTTT